ncbi:MAG: flagellar hook-length control protein FliK [Spirochaetaceae bacterium]|jgi:hypothetical protein|nr:flagellar hook-length control protein FliK [Spirochaetaceae bacterium]
MQIPEIQIAPANNPRQDSIGPPSGQDRVEAGTGSFSRKLEDAVREREEENRRRLKGPPDEFRGTDSAAASENPAAEEIMAAQKQASLADILVEQKTIRLEPEKNGLSDQELFITDSFFLPVLGVGEELGGETAATLWTDIEAIEQFMHPEALFSEEEIIIPVDDSDLTAEAQMAIAEITVKVPEALKVELSRDPPPDPSETNSGIPAANREEQVLFDLLTKNPSIAVIDERTMPVMKPSETGVSEKDDPRNLNIRLGDDGSAEITLMLPDLKAAGLDGQRTSQAINSTVPESRFSPMLQAEIQKNAGEFVKTGSILLQDNNAGSIRLVLHPESLGDVKIHLRLADNHIVGNITVASEEAYQAMKNSIQSLKAAFAESGFSAGSFDLSWSGGQNDGGSRQQAKPGPRDFFVAAREYDSAIRRDDRLDDAVLIENLFKNKRPGSINLVA